MENGSGETLAVGTRMRVRAHVQLGSLKPDDVAVELYLGRVNAAGEIVEAETTLMKAAGNDPRGGAVFEADPVMCARSGQHGFTCG